MRCRVLALGLAGVLWVGVAGAADAWVTTPGGSASCYLPLDRICYYDTASTKASEVVPSHTCENVSAWFSSDISDDTAFDNTAGVYVLLATAVDSADAGALLVDGMLMDGNPANAAGGAYRNFDAPKFYVRFANTSGTARVGVMCWTRD